MKEEFDNITSDTAGLSPTRRAILSATNPLLVACGAALIVKGNVEVGGVFLLTGITSTCLLIRDLLRDRELGQQATVSEGVTPD